jgi:hypothetical protein
MGEGEGGGEAESAGEDAGAAPRVMRAWISAAAPRAADTGLSMLGSIRGADIGIGSSLDISGKAGLGDAGKGGDKTLPEPGARREIV